MPLHTNGRNNAANGLAAAVTHLQVHSAWPGSDGTANALGARIAATWGSVSDGVRILTSSNETAALGDTDIQFITGWDAPTAGNVQAFWAIGGVELEMQVDVAADKIISEAHGFANGNQVVFMGGTPPGGLTQGTIYFVVGATTDDFQVAATLAGSAINLTSDGEARVCVSKIVPEHNNAANPVKPTGLTLAIGN